jgi:hypothetical protein
LGVVFSFLLLAVAFLLFVLAVLFSKLRCMLLFSHFLSLIIKNMENLKDVERKVVYPTKGPLKMDSCGFATIYCATTSTTPMENSLNVDVIV